MNYKHIIVALVAIAGVVSVASCGSRRGKTIENPAWQTANTQVFDITSITLTDTATIVRVDAYFHPRMWIRWDTVSYILGGGKKYMITGAEGIELCTEHVMPDSGKDSFVFYYEPIDPRLKTIDLIEGEPDDYFKIWGIDLTGKGVKDAATMQIPHEVLTTDFRNGTLPEPEFKSATTTVRLKVPGYREEMKFDPEMRVNSLFPLLHDIILPVSSSGGEWVFEFPLFGPTTARLMIPPSNIMMEFMLESGRENNVWIDLGAWSHPSPAGSEAPVWAYFDGMYAPYNMAYVNNFIPYSNGVRNSYSLSGDEALWSRMADIPSSEVYPAMKARRDELTTAVDTASLSPLAKEVLKRQIMSEYLGEISQAGYRIASQKAKAAGLSQDEGIPVSMLPTFTPDDYRAAYEGIDFNDPYLFYGMWYYRANDFMRNTPNAKAASGIEGTLSGNYLIARTMAHYNSGDYEVPEEIKAPVKAEFDAIENPFFKEAYSLYTRYIGEQKEIQRQKAAAGDGFKVNEAPADADPFDEIIAKYKGSVVVVDFWATWCSPCLGAMRQQAPLKDALIEQGVVFVYLTDQTSPQEKWELSIPDIKGEHYRLSNEQWREVTRKFDITGIPSYVLVSRDGSYAKDDNMRAVNVWESKIRAELEKK